MAGPGSETSGAAADHGRLRASHADRERVIGLLKAAFVQGRLTKDEFDARLGRAFAARANAELAALTTDLHPAPAGPQPVREPVGRRRAVGWLAAAVAAVLLAGVGVSLRAPGPGPAGHAVSLAGVPRYYVQQAVGAAPPGPGLAVRATATGAVTATVRCPSGQLGIRDIAAAGGQTFFMVCQQIAGKGANIAVTGSRVYRFRVTGSGRVTGFSLLPGGALPGLEAGSLAVSADGSEAAVVTSPGAAAADPPGPAEITVINTRTGARAVWRNSPVVPGKMTLGALGLSFTADGRELAFLGLPRCVRGPCQPTGNGEEVRAVSPAARGGSLSSSRLLVRQAALMRLGLGYIDGAVISPDGSSVAVLEMITAASGPPDTTVSVVQVSATTGRPQSVRYRVDTGNGFSYRFFGSDPSGRYLLLDAGPASGTVNGWIDHGRLIQLTPANGDEVFDETW
ncbi:MAG TPA: DUF1707 domain-containing protein [Streptosporangiaceae bacterium]|nr:DUF1707 domain-containing protein [Streptosporangiaceae bacterium]